MADSITVEGLGKRLGKKQVLEGISLSAPPGAVVALLGPNGAGKTTMVRVLSTLLRPDAGRVAICGVDVVANPRRIRAMIGLTGQFAAVDGVLTGRENLELVARLYRMGRSAARARTDELLDRFGLGEAADRLVRTYSGGMRRRLDLAASLLTRPAVLFLDEPTTGLDLRSRLDLWSEIEQLVKDGTTLLLTTQYLEEADRLASTVTVLDQGRTVAQGTPAALKDQIGGDRVEFTLADPADLDRATGILRSHIDEEPQLDRALAQVTLRLPDGDDAVGAMLRDLRHSGMEVATHAVRSPTLDDVFLTLTGTSIADSERAHDDAGGGRTARRGRRPMRGEGR
ncbi:ATP-binding cassette domain-containing protein [Streptomyces dysideae]|uniref:ABC transporter n=1 Tax=Streptomyces dysideae TaxID=909626 RepID=A0A101UT78_9ACTN|nr:ATP-binding cassette domain-containing protein [Streptomyces dysideae]KUO16443.1 ABC transporter [Streptomyces dysideae]